MKSGRMICVEPSDCTDCSHVWYDDGDGKVVGVSAH